MNYVYGNGRCSRSFLNWNYSEQCWFTVGTMVGCDSEDVQPRSTCRCEQSDDCSKFLSRNRIENKNSPGIIFPNLKLLKTFILSLFLGIAYRLCSLFLVKHQHHVTHSAIRQFNFVEFSEELQIEKRKRNCWRPACCRNENKNESHSHLAIHGAINSINCK